MNVFDCAIKIEEEARKFYLSMEAESSTAELKTLFSMLAAAEEEHLHDLVEMKNHTEPGKAEMRGMGAETCAFKPYARIGADRAAFKNDRDFYLHAIKEEEQDIRFYEELAAKAQDEETRQRLLAVAEQERRHLTRIENIYNFVEGPRNYLAWGEFSNLSEL